MTREIRIAFIGAGDVNFGGGEGPWDHASRLEKIGGLRLVGVADPNSNRAISQLAKRKGTMYDDTRVFADYKSMLSELKPDAVWIGVPPNAHGGLDDNKSMELDCLSSGIHMFVEKPLSCERPEIVRKVADRISGAGIVTSVGYMFRYSRAIKKIKDTIDETPGSVKAFIARYNCAYSEIRKPEWWDVRMSGGPIVEQATHFIDLARYLAGEVDPGSVKAYSVRGGDPAGNLVDIPMAVDGTGCGENVPPEFKHPRVTAAVWRFASGAIGNLTHATLLHKRKYETEIEVWGDGLRIVLQDPYGICRVLIRRPHSEETEEFDFQGDDAYLTENKAFLDAVRKGDQSGILSSYEDALKTYELTWAITDASMI